MDTQHQPHLGQCAGGEIAVVQNILLIHPLSFPLDFFLKSAKN